MTIKAATSNSVSSSAKADDPVRRDASVQSSLPAITGCPAFAGHDGIEYFPRKNA
jgi:hypothetical protein